MVPELESPANPPRPILALEPVSVMLPPLLLTITLVSTVALPVVSADPVNVRFPELIRKPGVALSLTASPPGKLIVFPAPIVRVVELNTVEAPQVVVPLPFQVKLEFVCTEIPPVMVLAVPLVVIVLLPPGADGVCNVPLTVRVPFKVKVEADRFILAAEIVPLEFEFIVPLVTVMPFVTANGAFTVRVTVVTLPMVRVEHTALELMIG